MNKVTHSLRRGLSYPGSTLSLAVHHNVRLWTSVFWDAWESLPLDQKITWIFFITNTIAVITLIELLILK